MAKDTSSSFGWIQKALIGAIVLLLLLTVLSKFIGQVDGPALYEKYYQRYHMKISDDHPRPGSRVERLLQFYENNQYEDALSILESFLRTQPNARGKIRIGAASCLLELGRTEEALTHLQDAQKSQLASVRTEASWYEALTLLRLGDAKAAKTLVQQLATDSYASHHKEAKALLAEW